MLFSYTVSSQNTDSNMANLPMTDLARYMGVADTLLESWLYPKSPLIFLYSFMTFLTYVYVKQGFGDW